MTPANAQSEALHFAEGKQWLSDFEKRNCRPLRVLHIGNIANNAYNNAKIQRERGIDAYVMALDYHHIMAAPEWEDADFKGDVGNPFLPDWWAVKSKGFRRPRWFVAGPIDLSIRYMLAELRQRKAAYWVWMCLQSERWVGCRISFGARVVRKILRTWFPPGQVIGEVPAYSLYVARLAEIVRSSPAVNALLPNGPKRLIANIERRIKYAAPFGRANAHMLFRRYREIAKSRILKGSSLSVPPDLEGFLEIRLQIWSHLLLRRLFSHFDIVQCYATYTALPFFIGYEPYLAYEHGTIREIPFQADSEGVLCTASYRAAARVFVTNTDNVSAARRMGISDENIIRLPHAFDDRKLLRFKEAHPELVPAQSGEAVFFAPARQDWILRDPGSSKNNDLIFRAAKILKDQGRKFSIVAVAWGKDLEASKRLCAELDIDDLVVWVPTMNKKDLWRSYLLSNAILDQFFWRAIGGVSFEVMALGRRLITSLDIQQCSDFFGEAPPVLEASTEEEIAAHMRHVIDDPQDGLGVGERSQEWMKKYHSADRIVSLQTAAYREIVGT